MNTLINLACFKVGEETFAADIMLIKEIILCRKVTRIPKAPDFIEGVINLRGKVIPLIDMRKRLGLSPTEPTRATRIIITRAIGKDVGLIVDSVVNVLRMEKNEVQAAPTIASGIESEYLKGIVRNGEELVLVLDIEKLLTSTEKVRLDEIFSSDSLEGV